MQCIHKDTKIYGPDWADSRTRWLRTTASPADDNDTMNILFTNAAGKVRLSGTMWFAWLAQLVHVSGICESYTYVSVSVDEHTFLQDKESN